MARKNNSNKINKYNNPEAARIVDLWRRARIGKLDDREKLLNTLVCYPNPDAFTKAWARMVSGPNYEKSLSKEDLAKEQKMKKIWDKSVKESSPVSRSLQTPVPVKDVAVMVSGGLPSLGRRSR